MKRGIHGSRNRAIKRIRDIQTLITRLEANASLSDYVTVRQECAITGNYLTELQTGKVCWQPGIGKTLRQIYKHLKWLSNDGRGFVAAILIVLGMVAGVGVMLRNQYRREGWKAHCRRGGVLTHLRSQILKLLS